jgi:amino acid transporter
MDTPPTPTPQSWRSLAADVMHEGRKMLEAEARTVTTELAAKSQVTKEVIGMVIAAAIAVVLALGCFSAAVVVGLYSIMPLWAALLLLTILWSSAAVVIAKGAAQRQQVERENEEESVASPVTDASSS